MKNYHIIFVQNNKLRENKNGSLFDLCNNNQQTAGTCEVMVGTAEPTAQRYSNSPGTFLLDLVRYPGKVI